MCFHCNQWAGTRTAPREIVLDNSILQPQDHHPVRVSTPPRVITLNEHRFPSATEDQYTPDVEQANGPDYEHSSLGSLDDRQLAVSKPKKLFQNEFFNTRYVQRLNGWTEICCWWAEFNEFLFATL